MLFAKSHDVTPSATDMAFGEGGPKAASSPVRNILSPRVKTGRSL